jgi:hypothetical protein
MVSSPPELLLDIWFTECLADVHPCPSTETLRLEFV